jgi:hypothetical protein
MLHESATALSLRIEATPHGPQRVGRRKREHDDASVGDICREKGGNSARSIAFRGSDCLRLRIRFHGGSVTATRRDNGGDSTGHANLDRLAEILAEALAERLAERRGASGRQSNRCPGRRRYGGAIARREPRDRLRPCGGAGCRACRCWHPATAAVRPRACPLGMGELDEGHPAPRCPNRAASGAKTAGAAAGQGRSPKLSRRLRRKSEVCRPT